MGRWGWKARWVGYVCDGKEMGSLWVMVELNGRPLGDLGVWGMWCAGLEASVNFLGRTWGKEGPEARVKTQWRDVWRAGGMKGSLKW